MLDRAVLFDFELSGRRVRLWKRPGESYEHVLMKALGYAMFVDEFHQLTIEKDVGLRYKPDLCAQDADGRFVFWGECGATSVRKINWLLKHAGVQRLVLFKIQRVVAALADELRESVDFKYRPPGRLRIVNFAEEIVALTASRRVARVSPKWYAVTDV